MAEITLDGSWRQIRSLIGRAEHAAEEFGSECRYEKCCGPVPAARDDAT